MEEQFQEQVLVAKTFESADQSRPEQQSPQTFSLRATQQENREPEPEAEAEWWQEEMESKTTIWR